MKKILLALFVTLVANTNFNAQIILEDNMDAYTLGAIGPQSDHWTTWSGTEGGAEDGIVSDVQAFSPSNSMFVDNTGAQDVVLLLGDYSTGVYTLDWKMYVDTTAYYNLQGSATIGGVFVYEMMFNQNADTPGMGAVDGVSFSFPTSEWFDIHQVIDLDNDVVDIYVAGVFVTSVANPDNMSSIDFFSLNANNQYYIDDIVLTDVTPEACFMPNAMICDDFDSYAADSLVALESDGLWTTWSDAPGSAEDAYVSDSLFFSDGNSVKLIAGLGTDLVLPFDNLTSGEYELGMKVYVPAGASGYYNVMHVFDGANATYEWALDVFFNTDGTGTINAGGNDAASFTYTQGEWVDTKLIADMDVDLARLYIGGALVHEWQWSLQGGGDAGTNALAAMDIYPGVAATDHFYIDNVYFQASDVINEFVPCFNADAIICDNIDNYTVGDYVASQSDGLWTTWSDAPGTAEDAFVSNTVAFAGNQSIECIAGLGTDLVLPFGDLTEGEYMLGMKVFVPTDASGYFNVMHTFDAANQTYEWGLDVFFNADGTGAINAGGNNAATFSYPHNEWVDVQVNIDLDWSWAILTIDGTEIYAWDWGLQAAGDAGANTLAVMDIYPGVEATDHFFIDNVFFETADNINLDSVDEFKEVSFVAYPNPNNGEFTVVNGLSGEYTLQLIDVVGRVVFTDVLTFTQGNAKTINTGVTTSGIYNVQMTNNKNNQSQSVQIVIE